MKKQYVKGYGKENPAKERLVTFALVGVCVVTLIITVTLAGILSSPDDAKNTPAVSTNEENIEVVEITEEEQTATEPPPEEKEAVSFAAPCKGDVILEFSPDVPLYCQTLDDWRSHNGLDIASPLGADVRSVADGIVSDKYEDFRYGYTVVIDHEGGLRSIYSNLAELDTAVIGKHVKCGDVISSVGDTTLFETVADTHLHIEMLLDEVYVNPLDYFELSK